jgi:2'-5' RNA ligase superfamily
MTEVIAYIFILLTSVSSLRMYGVTFQYHYSRKIHLTYVPSQPKFLISDRTRRFEKSPLRMTDIDPFATDNCLGISSFDMANTDDSVRNGAFQTNSTIALQSCNNTNDTPTFESNRKLQSQQSVQVRTPKKYHHLSVCMVPPESSTDVWEAITKCRIQFKDPGLYRWPPHANLLYPFIDIRPVSTLLGGDNNDESDPNIFGKDNNEDGNLNDMMNATFPAAKNTSDTTIDASIIDGLLQACRNIEPFSVKLHQFGTFGSNKRGVLWLYPDSYSRKSSNIEECDDKTGVIDQSPLVQLQDFLVQSFPYCNDQNVKSSAGFNPHMTVSHFINHQHALAAQEQVEAWWLSKTASSLTFPVDYIYLLQRSGDSGQFLRVADIPLGSSKTNDTMKTAIVHPTPIPFRHMPTSEEDWVYEERMKLKQRRNGQWRSRGNCKGNHNTSYMIVDDLVNTSTTTPTPVEF